MKTNEIKLKEIIEQVIETKSEIDICETYNFAWVWNLKYFELAEASYLALTYYNGHGSGEESGKMLPIKGSGFTYDQETNILEACRIIIETTVGTTRFPYVNTNSEKWISLQQAAKDCRLKKAFINRIEKKGAI